MDREEPSRQQERHVQPSTRQRMGSITPWGLHGVPWGGGAWLNQGCLEEEGG